MPPKAGRRSSKRAAIPSSSSSSSSSSSDSSSSSSSDEGAVAVGQSAKNSAKDSASENKDWDLSSLDRSREGSPTPAPSIHGSPAQSPTATLPPTAAFGPVGDDEKNPNALGPVGSDAKNSAAFGPVGDDEKNPNAHTAKSRDRDDECYVVDAEGRRVPEATGNSPVALSPTPSKKRATIEGGSEFLLTAVKISPLPSSAPTNSPPRGNTNSDASGNASVNAKTNASDNASSLVSSNASGNASTNASANASSNASDDASVHARKAGSSPKGTDARPGKGSPPPANASANAGGNANARTSAMQKLGSPAAMGGAAAPPQAPPQGHSTLDVGDICLTPEAAQIAFAIQNGDIDALLPLDCSPVGELQLQKLVAELQEKAEKQFNGVLPVERAAIALEVARHMPDSDGLPNVERALLLLKRREYRMRTKGDTQVPPILNTQAQTTPAQVKRANEVAVPAASQPPITQAQGKAIVPAKDEIAAAGDKRAMEQEQRIEALEEQLHASQVCTDAQKQLLAIRMEQLGEMRKKTAILVEQRELQEDMLLRLQHAEAPRPSKFAKLEDPSYATRLEWLVGRGHTFEDAMDALEATKEGDVYSGSRADAHLNAAVDRDRKKLLQKSNEAAKKMGDTAAAADLPDIEEHSALGHLLDKHNDVIDIVLKMRDVHAKSRAKAMHSAKNVLSAAHLVEQAAIKGNASLSRKGHDFLSRVALAVSEDCPKCQQLREKLEQEARWAKEREKAQEAKAKAEADKLTKEKEEKRRLEEEKRKPKPYALNFRPEDSKRDVTLPRGFCGACDKGQDKVRGIWLYPCGRCKKGYHLTCTTLTLVSASNAEYFACSTCLDELERNRDTGVPQPNFQVLVQDMVRRKAPNRGKAVGSQADSVPAVSGGGAAQPQAGGGTAHSMFQTPPPPSNITIAPHSGGDVLHTRSGGFDGDSDFLQPKTGNATSKTNVQIKDYFMWDDVPKDWVPKTDPKNPSKEETLPEHPEKGYGKTAYQNWRRRNVTARDVAQAGGGSLGPLSRSLSLEMRVCLGTQFHRDPAVAHLRPFPMADEKAFDLWLDQDPGFEWMKKLKDELLLELCDKKFGVKKNDLFLSKRYYHLPATNSKGEVLYHVSTFNRWITEWQNELSELKVSGCSFEGINLRQTLLNALAPNSMLHNEATVFKTESIHALIAHLRDWLMQEEEAATSLRNKQQSAIQNAQAAAGAAAAQGNLFSGSAAASNTQNANVLITQLVEQNQKLLETLSAGAHNPSSATGGKALPAHLKATEGNLCRCRGCNNTWNRGRKIPCFQGCKYADHPNYNKQCKTQDAPTQQKLTWAGFKDKFPSVTPPKGYLEWEAYVSARDKNKKNDGTK